MNFELLKRICETPGVPGQEDAVRRLVAAELQETTDSISVDPMGNLIGVKKGKEGGPKVMIAAHMDEIGFIVRHIDDKGFLRVQPLGGFDARVLIAQRVYVHGFAGETFLGAFQPAAKPTHLLTEEERKKTLTLDDLFIDIGLSGDEVRSKVERGDMVTLARTTEIVGGNVMSKSLDDRLCVFIMLEALKSLGETEATIYAVATVQEEVGLRGATTAAYAIEPDIAIALDITLAGDFPGGSPESQITALGKGAAIKIMDSSLICNPKLVRHFRDIAEKNNIPYQLEVLPRGGTDAGAMQKARGGTAAFTLSTPTRYVHTVNETASISDIEACIRLLSLYLQEAHTRSYGFEL